MALQQYSDPAQQGLEDEARLERLEKVHKLFVEKRDKWVAARARSGIETKWRKWEQLYDGSYEEDPELNSFVGTLVNGPSAGKQQASRSRIVINIVRPKVDSVVARQAEVLLPTDDKNWGIKPTPVPALAEIAADVKSNIVDMHTGKPMAAVATELIEQAKKAAELMQNEIDDVLTECNYNGECRTLLHWGTVRGSGIMKGPFPVKKTNKAWRSGPGGVTLSITSEVKPASKEISCWNVYPDPSCGTSIHKGSGLYEKRPINRRELRSLIGVPGYDEAAIRKVLGEKPTRVRAADNGKVTYDPCDEDVYELWEFHGEVGEDNMYTLTEDREQPLEEAYGMLVVVNETVIGALESWNPDKSIPYDIWVYRELEDSPFGQGLPEELEHQQRVVKSAWRALMDNAAAAAGFHIVMRKGAVVPVGTRGQPTIQNRMIWEANDEIDDVSKAFQVFTIDMRAEELLSIVNAAMQFADFESNLPQLIGGERGTAPETVGGMQLLDRNANGPLRFRVKRFDDTVTKGQIGRHYDWQMEYSPKNEIKGDYEVDARGMSYLLEKEVQAQSMLALPAVTNNPRYIPHLDEREELIQVLKAMKVDATQIMRPKEVVEQQMEQAAADGQPQDPRIASAQIQLQAKQLELEDREKQRAFEAERNNQELSFRIASLDYNRERETKEYDIAMTNAALDREQTLLKINNDNQLTREQMASKERLEAVKIDNQNAQFNAEMAVKVRQGSGI